MTEIVIESGIGTLNYGKQSAKGTKAVAATTTGGYNRPKWFDGVLSAKKVQGSEEYIDGKRFASPTTYTDTVGGSVGTPVLQFQPENAGLYYAEILGLDTVTGSEDPYTHTITSSGTSGAWGSWWQKVGASVGPERELYWDSKIGKLVVVSGTSQRPMHGSLDIFALNAAEVFETDAAKTEDATDPFYWNESVGSSLLDGTAVELDEEVVEIDSGLTPWYGQSIAPTQLIEKKGMISSTVKAICTDVTLAKYRKVLYGETAPATGTAVAAAQVFMAIKNKYEKSATRTLTITRPKVAVKGDDFAVGAQREGGEIPLVFGGECLKSGSEPALTVIALTGDATAYA